MFLKVNKKSGKTYLSIVEAVWENGSSKHKTIAALGAVESYSREQLINIGSKLLRFAGLTDNFTDFSSMKEMSRHNWGCVAVAQKLWDDFQFSSLFSRLSAKTKIKFPLEESIFKIVSTRLVKPMSKLALFQNQANFLGIDDVSLQHLYRCLDFLSDHKDDIEEHIYKCNRDLFNMQVDVVFYDVTTFYFESNRPDSFKNFGYSKDCKFGEVQVVLGMIMNSEGRPVGFEYFPGNTFEGSTLTAALEKLKQKFQIERVIVVADRGINSKLNLKAITDAGYHYIVGSRLKSMKKPIQKQVLDQTAYETVQQDENKQPIFKVAEFAYQNEILIMDENKKKTKRILKERLICSWSLERAKKDKSDRSRLIEKARSLVTKPSEILNKRGARKYIDISLDQGEVELNEARILADEAWDGFYGIQTSDPLLTKNEIMDAYKKLWKIEEIFRVMKSTLETRPMFHWTPNRIKGHLTACFMAFVIERTIEIEVFKKKDIHLSAQAIQDALASLQISEISIEGKILKLRSAISKPAQEILNTFNIIPPKPAQFKDDIKA